MFLLKLQEMAGNDSQRAGHHFQQQEVGQEEPGLCEAGANPALCIPLTNMVCSECINMCADTLNNTNSPQRKLQGLKHLACVYQILWR